MYASYERTLPGRYALRSTALLESEQPTQEMQIWHDRWQHESVVEKNDSVRLRSPSLESPCMYASRFRKGACMHYVRHSQLDPSSWSRMERYDVDGTAKIR